MPFLCDCYHCPACKEDACEDFQMPLYMARKLCQEERTLFMQEMRVRV